MKFKLFALSVLSFAIIHSSIAQTSNVETVYASIDPARFNGVYRLDNTAKNEGNCPASLSISNDQANTGDARIVLRADEQSLYTSFWTMVGPAQWAFNNQDGAGGGMIFKVDVNQPKYVDPDMQVRITNEKNSYEYKAKAQKDEWLSLTLKTSEQGNLFYLLDQKTAHMKTGPVYNNLPFEVTGHDNFHNKCEYRLEPVVTKSQP